jgi:hypothetical protein
MESQTVPSKMLKFLVGAMQSVLDEVGLRYVRFCTRLVFVRGTPWAACLSFNWHRVCFHHP